MVKIIVTTRSETMGTTLEARDFVTSVPVRGTIYVRKLVACSSPMATTLRNGTTN